MRMVLNIMLSLLFLIVPTILSEQFKAKPLFYTNILIILFCYYAGYLLVLRKLFTRNRLIVAANVLPVIGVVVGFILNKVYEFNCDFERAVIDRPEVCNLIFVSEKFIYSAIYIGGVVLVMDIILIIRSFLQKKSSGST